MSGIDRCLARRLQSHDDVVVIRRRHLVPDLEFVEPLRALGHVDRHELAVGRLDVHAALGVIDRLHGARNGEVCVGSSLTCAQPGKERAKTNPDALRIAVTGFMLSLLSGSLWRSITLSLGVIASLIFLSISFPPPRPKRLPPGFAEKIRGRPCCSCKMTAVGSYNKSAVLFLDEKPIRSRIGGGTWTSSIPHSNSSRSWHCS